MAPVEFDVEVVVLFATNTFEYITFAPTIIPPMPDPVVIEVVTFKVGIDAVVRTVRLPVIVKLPVITPPVFALILLLALVKAELA